MIKRLNQSYSQTSATLTKRQGLELKRDGKRLTTNQNKESYPANPGMNLNFIVKQSNAKAASRRR